MPLLHGELTKKIIEAFYEVAFELGSGWHESVYAAAMEIALREKGLDVRREVPLKVYFRGRVVKIYRADTLVESRALHLNRQAPSLPVFNDRLSMAPEVEVVDIGVWGI
jgi:hypothetical protein